MYKLLLIIFISFLITGCLIPHGYMMARSGEITIIVTDKNNIPLEKVEVVAEPYFNRDYIDINSVSNKEGMIHLKYKLSSGCRSGIVIKYFHFTLKKDNYQNVVFYVSNRSIGKSSIITFNKKLRSK